MFKNKLWPLVGAGLVATSVMIAGLAHAEVCVENDAGLSEQQLSVAFTATKDASPQNPIDWHRLPNGEQYCQGSDGIPLYIAIYIRPRISDPRDYSATPSFYFSRKPVSIAQNDDIGFAVELNEHWTPKVTAGNGGDPKTVPMDVIRTTPQPQNR